MGIDSGVGTDGTGVVISDIQTPLGDSVLDETNDAINVNIVAGGSSGVTDTDDDSIAKEQVLPLFINENYAFSKGDDVWKRMQLDTSDRLIVSATNLNTTTDDGTVDVNSISQTAISLIYGYDAVAGVWERVNTDTANSLSVKEINLTDADSDNSIGVSGAKKSLQDEFQAITDWVESAGADNLATNVDHRGQGTVSLEFDKIAGDTTAMISKTIASFDMGEYSMHAIGHMHCYLSDLTNVDYVFVRLGTDSTNYWQWDFDGALFENGWSDINTPIGDATSQTGNGANLSAITWIAFGVVFDAAANTLADIRTSGWTIKRVMDTAAVGVQDIQLNSPFLVIKDQNSNTRLDVANGATYNYLYNRNTDGTNLMPTMDAAARRGYVQVTDGTNTMPTMDASARVGHQLVYGSDDGGTTKRVIDTDSNGKIILGSSDGIDIGDVTVNNASGSGVYVQPGAGITFTVDATNLDIRDLDYTTDDVKVYGSQNAILQQKVTTNDLIVTLDGETVAATQSGTWNVGTVTTLTNLGASNPSAAMADNTANPTIPKIQSYGMVYDGSTWDRQLGDSINGTLVNLGSNNDVMITGTVPIEGEVARDAAVTNVMPVLVGGRTSDAAPTAMSADGDNVDVWASRRGGVVTLPYQADTTGTQVWAELRTVTTSGTEIAATSTAKNLAWGFIKAHHDNTGVIHVGRNGVTITTGYPLLAGESIPIAGDGQEWYCDATVSGERFWVIGVTL